VPSVVCQICVFVYVSRKSFVVVSAHNAIVASRMQFLLPRYLEQRRRAEPESGIACPAELTGVAHRNGLSVVETTTNGNCGLDGFGKALVRACQDNHALASSAAVKKFSKQAGNTQAMCDHLRKVAVDWMTQNRETTVWTGMSFGQLAMSMHGKGCSYGSYIQQVSLNGTWLDAAGLHGLAVHYGVDLYIFQAGMDPALLGPSLNEANSPSKATISLGMVNDLHYWALLPFEDPGQHALVELPDKGASA
jgi:hypothetical protein